MLIYFLLICRHVTIYLYGEHSTDQQESDQRAIHQLHFFKACFTLSNKFLKLNDGQIRVVSTFLTLQLA
jgi:hypothetical protein